MDCLDNKDIPYESYIHKLGVKEQDDKFGYFTPRFEVRIDPSEIEFEKAEFVNRCDEMTGKDVIRHHKYCVEYKREGYTYLEYIMGFVKV
jgi:hypothetical protein